eukprot:5446308-Amphidinium_carterae.1
MAQVLFGGKTARVFPTMVKEYVHLDYTESHWQTTANLRRFIEYMDAIVNKDTPKKHWICVMDTAPVHIAT